MEHQFNVGFAELYGIEEAIIIHNLYFWIMKNIANNVHEHNGRHWTYNSNVAFVELFPYMNKTKICRVMSHLEKEEIILKDNFNKDGRDRTLWYAFSDKGLDVIKECGYDISKMSRCTIQNELCTIQNEPPLPYSKQTDNKHKEKDIDKSISQKKSKSFDVRDDLSYVAAEYVDIWNEWLDYKDEIKAQYKVQRGAIMQYNSLLKYADNNVNLAIAIVHRSIEQSWTGLFALTDKQKKLFSVAKWQCK